MAFGLSRNYNFRLVSRINIGHWAGGRSQLLFLGLQAPWYSWEATRRSGLPPLTSLCGSIPLFSMDALQISPDDVYCFLRPTVLLLCLLGIMSRVRHSSICFAAGQMPDYDVSASPLAQCASSSKDRVGVVILGSMGDLVDARTDGAFRSRGSRA